MQFQPFLQLIRVCSKTNTTVVTTFCREQLLKEYLKVHQPVQYTIKHIPVTSPLHKCDVCPTAQTRVKTHSSHPL